MKILFISDKFPPCFDGIGDYTYYLAQEFERQGHETHVLCSDDEKIIKADQSLFGNINVHASAHSWSLSSLGNILKQIKQINPDTISLQYNPYGFSHWGIPLLMPFLMIALRLNRFKIDTMFHEIAIRLWPLNPKIIFVGIAQRIIANMVHLLSRRSITSIGLYSSFILFAKNKLSLVPVGCNIDDGQPPRFSKPQDEVPTLAYFGSNPRGLFDVPVILDRLMKKGIECKFVFIGKFSKESMDTIYTMAKKYGVTDAIEFTGFLTAAQAMERLRKASIYLGLMEDTGITLKSGSVAAAYCAGLPVIGTEGDMTDTYFFKHDQNCILVKNDPEQIAGAIQRLSQDANQMTRLAKAARDSFDQWLSWPALYRQYNRS